MTLLVLLNASSGTAASNEACAHESPARGVRFGTPGWRSCFCLIKGFRCQLSLELHLHAFEAPLIPGTFLLQLLLLLLLAVP